MLELRRRYGEIVGVTRGQSKYLCVFSPELIGEVLAQKDLFYTIDLDLVYTRIPRQSAQRRIMMGLAFMNGVKHSQQRRLMMPAFQRTAVDGYVDEIVSIVDGHIGSWRLGEVRSISQEMRTLSSQIAMKTILGLATGHADDLSELLEEWMLAGFSRTAVLMFMIPGTPFYRMMKLAEQIEPRIERLIVERQRNGHRGKDALSRLLEARTSDPEQLTDDELVAQTLSLYLGGHLTSSHALTWIIFLLVQFPDVLHRLVNDLERELGDGPPTISALGRVPLLEGVIFEGLRLLPPTTWLVRVASQPCRLGAYRLDRGDFIVISPSVTHRDSAIFPEPNRFRPDRWNGTKFRPYDFLGYSAGPRRCPGADYANLEMSIVLAIVLRRFRLDLLPGTRVDRGRKPLAYVTTPLPMRIHSQDHDFRKTAIHGDIVDLVDL